MRRFGLTIAVIALFALAPPGAASPAGVVTLTARLSGKYLHTSSASGTAKITVNGTRVCWTFRFTGLDALRESGIHQTPPPRANHRKHSVIPFTAKTTKHGCVAAPAAWAKKLVANPGGYYVDIHTAKYPKGAIGGRLRKK